MPRPLRHALPLLTAAGLALSGHARATDIDCDPAAAPASQMPSHRLICESALFSMGYQRIFAEQQRLLKAGQLTEAELTAFRAKRDGCQSASCLDTVFREWKAKAANASRKP
ncbi:hypothetical protein CupriaWKF_28060 [Cupriavidus sp. WKF15]|uniref:hypothetical protein n=1 Tax=Cupriavidus sp. WKF15 TaxID=3032282 RepID=UPI0023E1FA45|nr:hypothetical protein [Cupriavidus sp. WKF15]WER48626.1 hypothetical protein CupriaWKF_28060 [Cupriavidus sp. WKF15]